MGMLRVGVAAVAGVALIGGWSSGSDSDRVTASESSSSVSSAPSQPAGYVSEATWTDGPWPFTVPEGVLDCGSGKRVTFSAGGEVYAVNGAAKSAGIAPADAIWKDDPAYAGIKVNIGPMITRGLDLC